MQCPKCAAENPDNITLCFKCGHRLKDNVIPVKKRLHPGWKVFIVLVVASALIVLSLLGIGLINDIILFLLDALVMVIGLVIAYVLIIQTLIAAVISHSSEKQDKKIIVVLFIISLLWSGARHWYGDNQIGSIFECRNYENAMYYGYLYQDYSDTKNYKVMVEIDRVDGFYFAEKIYFDNKKKNYVLVMEQDGELRVGEKVRVETRGDKEWRLEITSQKAKKNQGGYLPF